MRRWFLAFALVSACSSESSAPPAASVDSAVADTFVAVDSGVADTTMMVEDTPPASFSEKLSAMDLYSDISKKTVAARNTEFRPSYELWSDGAEKKRWIAIPAGGKID